MPKPSNSLKYIKEYLMPGAGVPRTYFNSKVLGGSNSNKGFT